MRKVKTIKSIVTAADKTRRALFDLDRDLEKQLDKIRFDASKQARSLSIEEKKVRTQIRASQSEIRNAIIQLDYVTASRLDKSEEVLQLKQRIENVNQDLNDDLKQLKKIEGMAKKVSLVADKLTDVVIDLAAKAAVLAK